MDSKITPGIYIFSAWVTDPAGDSRLLVYDFAASDSNEFSKKVEDYGKGLAADGYKIECSVTVPMSPELIQDLETERVEE